MTSERVKQNQKDFKLELINLKDQKEIAEAQREKIKIEGLKIWEIQSRFNGIIRGTPEKNALEKLEIFTAKLNGLKRILKGWKI